jgi:hypothetical protein
MTLISVKIGHIKDVIGEVNIAAGDIYNGFTAEQVDALIKKSQPFRPKPCKGAPTYF